MNHSTTSADRTLKLFQPSPGVFYSLDAIATLAGVSRRSILIYSRAGLIRPEIQPPYEFMAFNEEAIHAVRKIEHLRTVHGLEMQWIKTFFDLAHEVEHLRAEVRFWRKH